MPRDCVHGHQARKCELCERDEKIAALKAENARLRAALDHCAKDAGTDSCADLALQVEKLKSDYDAEVSEFNAGYEAAKAGKTLDDEPSEVPFDVWRCGFAWQRFDGLRAEVERMKPVVDAAKEWHHTAEGLGACLSLHTAVRAYRAGEEAKRGQ